MTNKIEKKKPQQRTPELKWLRGERYQTDIIHGIAGEPLETLTKPSGSGIAAIERTSSSGAAAHTKDHYSGAAARPLSGNAALPY